VAIDTSYTRSLLAMSAIGTSTEVRAFRAALQVGRGVQFHYCPFEKAGKQGRTETSGADSEGYAVRTKAVGDGHFHLVAISKRKTLLVNRCHQAVWRYLQLHTTTPLDERWLAEVVARMEKDQRIVDAGNRGPINAALVLADDKYLDEVAMDLVKKGTVRVAD